MDSKKLFEFKKFPEIENATPKYIDIERTKNSALFSKGEWIVLEKVHGANFSFYCDEKDVKIAKRTSFINPSDYKGFYNCESIINDYIEKIIKLFKLCKVDHPNTTYIIVYGELFGGFYPGCGCKDSLIQKGVYYSPSHAFYAFDLCIYDTSINNIKFINYNDAISYFKEAGIMYAQILYKSLDFNSVLEWSNKHKQDITTIPDYFKLPQIKDNFMEGHVIKPIEQPNVPVFFKNKNPKFLEVKVKKEKQEHKVDSQIDILYGEIEMYKGGAPLYNPGSEGAKPLQYITQQRYDNMISKVGPTTPIGQLVKLLTEDAIKDYKKENEIELTEDQMKKLTKSLYKESQKIILNNKPIKH